MRRFRTYSASEKFGMVKNAPERIFWEQVDRLDGRIDRWMLQSLRLHNQHLNIGEKGMGQMGTLIGIVMEMQACLPKT